MEDCCNNEENIHYNDNLGKYSCIECGCCKDYQKQSIEYVEGGYAFIPGTYIKSNFKFRKLIQLQKWSNYDYKGVRDYNIKKYIDSLPFMNREVLSYSKIIFMQEYHKLKIRGKVKKGLICYAIYKAHLILHLPIDICKWFEILEINVKHYNSANKKVLIDQLFYPVNLDKYLNKLDIKIDKNILIREYNDFLSRHSNFNTKTIILSIIYNKMDNHSNFFKIFKISNTSIIIVNKLLNEKIKKID